MKQDKKLIFDAFAHLFIIMMENETDNMELTFDFNKCKAKFKVNLVELQGGGWSMPHINKQEMIKQDKELMSELEQMYLDKATCNEMSRYILEKRGLEIASSTINKMLIDVFGYRVGKVRDLSTPEIIERISQWQIDGCGVKEIRRKLDKELGIKTSVPTIYRALGTTRTVELPKKVANKKILLVEDGSVDVERLERDGFYVIVYRQGANKPEFLR